MNYRIILFLFILGLDNYDCSTSLDYPAPPRFFEKWKFNNSPPLPFPSIPSLSSHHVPSHPNPPPLSPPNPIQSPLTPKKIYKKTFSHSKPLQIPQKIHPYIQTEMTTLYKFIKYQRIQWNFSLIRWKVINSVMLMRIFRRVITCSLRSLFICFLSMHLA